MPPAATDSLTFYEPQTGHPRATAPLAFQPWRENSLHLEGTGVRATAPREETPKETALRCPGRSWEVGRGGGLLNPKASS